MLFIAQTLLACLQEASAVQLEAWGGLCDGMALHFAFFAKSSSPRLKVELKLQNEEHDVGLKLN